MSGILTENIRKRAQRNLLFGPYVILCFSFIRIIDYKSKTYKI